MKTTIITIIFTLCAAAAFLPSWATAPYWSVMR